MTAFGPIAEKLTAWWTRANSSQRALVAGGAGAALVSIAVALYWAAQPNWVVLFSGLDPVDAGPIVEELEDAEVRYQIARNGTTVRVPADRVGELRIRIASRGLTGSQTLGYEIFDRSNLGMTDFLQQVNYRRALEGELSRTISSIAEVRTARVHLAIPERSVFRRDQRDPTASAILELEPGAHLRADQERGIVALVAASVEGLRPGSVTLIDSSGRQLSEGGSAELAATSGQLRLQREVEDHLRSKARSLLEQVVGTGQVIVQVNADLDFERVERSVESYDPASSVIRSEERTREGPILTNYEIDHTVETILGSVGTIRRLSVAVLVNGSYETQADGEARYIERSPRELAALSAIVRDAVGWEDSRGDTLELANLRFAEPPTPETVQDAWPAWLSGPSVVPITRALTIVAIVAIVAGAIRRSASVRASSTEPERRAREPDPGATYHPDVIRREMHTLAKDRPSEVAQILRSSWLVEEKTR